MQWKTPVKLTSITCWNVSDSIFNSMASRVMPALLMSTSTFPKWASTFSAVLFTSESLATFVLKNAASIPCACNRAASFSPAFSLKSIMATCAPCFPNSSAATAPIPFAPPVMTTVFPFIFTYSPPFAHCLIVLVYYSTQNQASV